jgi:hypothetical protein
MDGKILGLMRLKCLSVIDVHHPNGIAVLTSPHGSKGKQAKKVIPSS